MGFRDLFTNSVKTVAVVACAIVVVPVFGAIGSITVAGATVAAAVGLSIAAADEISKKAKNQDASVN